MSKKNIKVSAIQQAQTPALVSAQLPLSTQGQVSGGLGASQLIVGPPLRKQTTYHEKAATTSKKSKKGKKTSEGAHNTGTETETFSSIIKIHRNQEEMLDFEQFIKSAKVDEKNESDEEDSDSSGDSEESSNNLIVE